MELSFPPNFQTSFNKYIVFPSRWKAPLSFTFVCSWWRAVAFGIPQLWTSVSGTQDWTKSTTSGLFTLWMNNVSRNNEARREYGLDLHLAPPRPTPSDIREGRRMVRVLRIFWANIQRCRSLNLRLDKNTLHALRTLILESAAKGDNASPPPFLEDLELSFTLDTTVYNDFIDDLIIWLRKLPSLRRLRLTYVGMFNESPIRADLMPWSSFHEVHITCGMSFENSVAALTQSTSARTVRLAGMGWTTPTPLQLSRLELSTTTLHFLTSLTLADSINPPMLLDYLTLPSLKNLTIRTGQAFCRLNVSNFSVFLKRSQCSLERLTISGLRMTQLEVATFFRLPGVSKMALVDISFDGVTRMFENRFEDAEMRNMLGDVLFIKLLVWTTDVGEHEMEQHVGWKDKWSNKETLQPFSSLYPISGI
ncbi:hypothetical protein M413DRAFT_12814 [Hebeloma cylindrosporum]|uniref:F-box domain-containing protein n=1 Tax=Hebeloma cylindrosporum TaxID=76867 RepID=A0A0C2XKQ2_HEBCY|nr:hypothetical protein M413DRAFT_12814 [Hebeloma cylindrosporum h7]